MDRYPHQLQAAAEVMRMALLNNPALIMDEPSTALMLLSGCT
jgi:ABC-type microcin C transport system duplicated ATPase subunit YejF